MLKGSRGGGGGGGGGGDQSNKTKKKKKDGAAATPSLKDCANCGASEGTIPGITVHKPCSRCMCTFYCSVRCQKRHWKVGGHKHSCVPMEDRSVEKAKEAEETTKKKKNVNRGAAAAEEDEEDICAICQYPLSEEPCTRMPCSHVYHVACVEKLRSYDVKQVCPTCRVDLPPGPEQVFEEAVRRWMVLHRRYGQGDDEPWRRIRNTDDRRENAEVVRMMTEAAEQGHALAQQHLGFMYNFGQGVPQSLSLIHISEPTRPR